MTPTKLLIGQIIVVLTIILLGVWAATQWAASMLGYQPQLGLEALVANPGVSKSSLAAEEGR